MGLHHDDVTEVDNTQEQNKEEESAITTIDEFDAYIEELNVLDVRKLVYASTSGNSTTPMSEATHIGSFVSGEQIIFSKYYSAVIFDATTGSVSEKKVENLVPGDVLVFTKRDDYTKNIVDYIYEKLLKIGKLGKEAVDVYEKSQYWKEALREYKENNNLGYRDISKKLKALGSSLQEVTIRQWLMEDSHIVGPRDEKTMEYIAALTGDDYLLSDTHAYFEACRTVRHDRRAILEFIAEAINEKLRGHLPPEGSVLQIVYENVESLSETLELSYISPLDPPTNININLINKPITETEVLM